MEEKKFKTEATVAGIGDILIHDWVYEDAKTSDGYDFKPMFEKIKPILQKPDFLIANQESVPGGTEIGISNTVLEVRRRSAQGIGRRPGRRGAHHLGAVPLAGAQPDALVAVDGDPGAAVLRAGAADRARVHRAALQQVRSHEGQGAREPGARGGREGGRRGRARLRGEQERRHREGQRLRDRRGQTKRIVLWDTLLARLTPEQTRFVVGHELGHYVLGHVWINIFVSWLLTMLGLFAAHRTAGFLLARFGGRFGFTRLADPASLPLLMLLLSLFSFVIAPAALALSRHHEQRGRSLRPGPDPRQPRRRQRLRRAAKAEPGRPAPGPALQVLPRQPPAHRRARGLHQRLPAALTLS